MVSQQMVVNIAVFASGSGSNALKIIEYFEEKPEIASVRLLVANKPAIGALLHAENHGVDTFLFSNQQLRENPDVLLKKLQACHIDFIVLAGFLSKIPPLLTSIFAGRLLNIHPALLPNYGGKGMYGHHVHEAVLRDGRTESGITIHQVNAVYDEGEILHQAKVVVTPDDTADSLQKKIQALEHHWYPLIIERTIAARKQ
jgi:phosphoribosylglycinamide formyltransferase-1